MARHGRGTGAARRRRVSAVADRRWSREQLRLKTESLHAAGVAIRAIATALDLSYSTVYRWLNQEYAGRRRRLSREAKRRRTGVCARCGAVARYAGGRRRLPIGRSRSTRRSWSRRSQHDPRPRGVEDHNDSSSTGMWDISYMKVRPKREIAGAVARRTLQTALAEEPLLCKTLGIRFKPIVVTAAELAARAHQLLPIGEVYIVKAGTDALTVSGRQAARLALPALALLSPRGR